MRPVSRFIVKHRIAIAALFIVLAAVSILCTLQVTVNKDMTQYLPANMQVKQGMDIMSDEFGDATVIRAMVKDVPESEKSDLADDLADFSLIASVSYESDSPDYNSGDYTLYEVTLEGNSYSSSAQSAYDAIDQALESRGYEHWIAADLGNSANSLMPVYVAGVLLAMIILFTLASSWIEPVLLLITIVIAVLLNMGTNLLLPSISDTTFSIAAILQMVLSMDYLIMLMNLYRAEREEHPPELAMENALTKGVSTIASSSVTTVVGLLCLVFMSFTIGADLGIVLAKGVLLSLICVFAVQPALAIAADGLIFSTAKPYPQPKMLKLSAITYKLRVPLLIVFLVLFAAGYSMRGVTQIDFVATNSNNDTATVNEVFPAKQQVVVLYEAQYTDKANELADKLADDERIASMSNYARSLGKPYTADQMADQMGMSSSLVGMLYYYYFNDGDVGVLTKSDLLGYLRDGVKSDLGSMLDETTLESIDTLADLVDSGVDAGTYTPAELTAAIGKHSVSEQTVRLLYLAYRGSHDVDSSWTMTLDGLTAYLTGEVMNDDLFSSFFSASTRETLTAAREQIESGAAKLQNADYGRFIMTVPYASDSDEMDALLNEIRADASAAFGSDTGWYLVGEGPMVQEMSASFSDEFNFLSILTIIAIFIIVLITFRSIAVPIVLVALIQCAFCWDMILNYGLGVSIYYLALLVVQSILMGATIDYAILFTENYRQARSSMDMRDAVANAYQRSIRTISMSGGILVVVTGVLGMAATGLTGKICLVISEGSFIAVALVLLVLPGAIMALDRLIVPRKKRFEGTGAAPTGGQPGEGHSPEAEKSPDEETQIANDTDTHRLIPLISIASDETTGPLGD